MSYQLSLNTLNRYKYVITGYLTFTLLFVFACVLAKERVLFTDSAAQVFELINDNGFHVYVKRYSMYLFQLLPVLAIKLHLPLSVIIYAYSISPILIAFILWLITIHFLKNKHIAILMLFVMLGIRQTFFHAISETFQVFFYASFLYAWIFRTSKYPSSLLSKSIYYCVAFVFMALCIFIHPVAIFFLFFIVGMCLLDKNKTATEKILLAILSVIIIVCKFLTIEQGGHDASFMISKPEFFERMLHLFTYDSCRCFFMRIPDFYWSPLLMLTASLVYYWKKKKYGHFAFVSCFIFGFWITTVIIYAAETGWDMGLERSYLPMFFFCGIPFLFTVFSSGIAKWDKVYFIGFVVLLMGGFIKIAEASKPYTKRLDRIEEIGRLANKEGKKKLLICQKDATNLFPVDSWALGLESMLYTAREGRDSTVNIYLVDTIDLKDRKYKDTTVYLVVPWDRYWHLHKLNSYYFRLPQQSCSQVMLDNDRLSILDLEE
jgi:hypothetical protein